ncbi:MAG: SGNH/GDSL hydrolase family protein, partial [Actinomycetales bacterium]
MAFHRYVALGDSFTEGVGDHDPARPNAVRGWADRVAEVLAGQTEDFSYANLAIRGRKLLPIIDEQLEPALALAPDLVSLYAGANDVLRPRIDVPEPVVAVLAQPPEVDERGVVALGHLTDELVVDGEPTAQRAEDRRPSGVVGREHHDVGAGLAQAADGEVVGSDEPVDVDAGAEDVVGAGVEAHEVGLERERGLELLVDDGQQLPAADGEVGVGEVLGLTRQ